jgi:hypothetical protein
MKLFPYKFQCFQQFSPEDGYQRLTFCEEMKQLCYENHLNIENIIFSDECHIYLHGLIKKQNYRN